MYGENTEDYDLEEQASIVAKAIKIRLEKCLQDNWSDWIYYITDEWDFDTSEDLDELISDKLMPLWRELNK